MSANSCQILDGSLPSTSKAARLMLCDNDDIEMEENNDDTHDNSIWSIEDTLFYAQGLMNHSGGKGKSVFVTWNENYLINFVFKTSKNTRKSSLTKVHLTIPTYDSGKQREEIEDILILEMNTLIHMKSGHVYYFTSVKSMHQVEWLTGVRCMSSCPQTQFSVIRLVCDPAEEGESRKILSLEVYQDKPELGKCSNGLEVLRHSYDITFDFKNIFNCDWLDERYTLLSLITCEENLEFLQHLVAMGNIFRPQEENIVLANNQEFHMFTVSGNIFILIGALISDSKSLSSNPEIEDYSIQLLNTYASNIECVRIDVQRNLVIVLLQSGHMDIWYKSNRMFGVLLHHQQQVSQFLHYDYTPTNNTFYFTTPDDVIKLEILTSNDGDTEEECMVQETHKAISGMIACTWVETLQQLICLSFNNIFYRLCFERHEQHQDNLNDKKTHFENFNKLYVLTTKRVKHLMGRAQIVKELMEQPARLHQAIEEEFQKQQLLAMETKHEILAKLFHCYIEYHVNIPGIEYFPEDCITIRTKFNNSNKELKQNTVYCLIFISLRKKDDFVLSVITTPQWYLHISDQRGSLLLHVPSKILQKKMCLIVKCYLENINKMLPYITMNILTFLNHCSSYISLNFKITMDANENTYCHIFTHNLHNLPLFRDSKSDIEYLLKEFNTSKNNNMDDTKEIFKLQCFFKVSQKELLSIFKKLHIKTLQLNNVEFKLFYLHEYLLELKYDQSKEELTIFSEYPEALFYIKLFLAYQLKTCRDVEILITDTKKIQKMIMQYQFDIERLYGALTSSDWMDVDSSTISIHLENIRKVYLKLRTEFNEIC